jgi:hypothetical protein
MLLERDLALIAERGEIAARVAARRQLALHLLEGEAGEQGRRTLHDWSPSTRRMKPSSWIIAAASRRPCTQVNTGSCWRTAGSIGRQAHGLIEAGYLLAAKEPTKDWIGHAVATRDQVQAGMPGSPGFVEAAMSCR